MQAVDQAALWVFIRDKVWISLVVYVCILVLAGARDITHQQFAKIFSLRNFHQNIISTYQDTKGFFYIELFRFLSNVVICCVYVYSTYARTVSTYVSWVNRAFACIFALDLILGMLFASSAVLFIFSYARFLQIFSLPSLFLAAGPHAFLHFGFLRAFSAYDSYIRVERRMVLLPFAPKKFAFRLTVQFLTLFYVLAAGIQMLEIPGDLLHPSFLATWNDTFGGWNFFNCIYFVIVTLSTVGYGDISPATIQGRIYAIFMIIIGIIVFSNIANDIMSETRRQRGDGSYNARIDTRHVILSGTPTLDDLVHFVTEFYADERHSNSDCDIVVLIEDPKWTDMQWYRRVATNHFLTNHITYLVGKLKNVTDLDRAGIKAADAVFILTTPGSSGEASRQDSTTVMSALAIRNVRTDIPIFSQILLEESSTQINAAMRSARSAEPEPRLMFRDKMLTSSMYRGIFKDTERLEREHLAAAFRESDSAEYSSGNPKDGDSNDFDDYNTDLLRSSFVCLQQLYSALLVANIKANGVGTLCTNMYLDNPDTGYGLETGPASVPWLQEYQMGAACSLSHAIIPRTLDGARIDSIASLLLRRGVQIVATQQRGKLDFDTVLSTSNKLQAGELGMFLTYLSSEHLATAVHLVGHEYETGVKFGLSRYFKSQKEKPEEEAALAVANMRRKRSRRTSSVVNLPAIAAKYHTDRNARRRQSHIFSRSLRMDSQSFEFGGVRQETDYYQSSDGAFDLSMNDMPGSSTALIRSRSHWEIPPDITDHIIVAMEGDTPLTSLPFFLELLWHKDGRFAEMGRPNVPVIIVHPQGADHCSDLFREYDRRSLFFVKGSPAASATWKNAKLGSAKAVATMADYTQDWEVADSRTVYTLLTLDALTTEQQNLFICSELIDEQSLDYLREPLHPRRRGARMGNPILRQSHSNATFTPRTPGSGNDEDGESHQEVSPKEGTERSGATKTLNQSIDAENGVTSLPPEEDYFSDDFDSEFSSTVVSGPPSLKEEECATNALFTAQNQGEDAAYRPGVSRARRRELFSRYRYTSGELLVHSTADTLLVREYAEPGFVKFITGLCGADSTSPGQKIRLVRIPKSLFREYNLVNGQRLIEYGVVFERLVALGVTPLGLYRSGDAPARLPKFKRSKRGQQIYNEAALIQTQTANRPVRWKGEGFKPIKSLVKTGQNVMPGSVLERRGVKELLGGGQMPAGMFKRSGNDAKFEMSSTRSARQEPVPVLESPEGSMNDSGSNEVHAALGPANGEVGATANGIMKDEGSTGANAEMDAGAKEVVVTKKKVPPMKLARKNSRKNSRLSVDSVCEPLNKNERNLLPYVYTMPDINTLVAETDGVYILCDPLFELPRIWLRPESFSA